MRIEGMLEIGDRKGMQIVTGVEIMKSGINFRFPDLKNSFLR
jgi:hypothetical protein